MEKSAMFRASSFVIDSDFVIRISFIIRHLAVSDIALPPICICSGCTLPPHAFVRNFAQATSGDAATGGRAFSTCVAAALHFRAALSRHAKTRASASSHVLRHADEAELPGVARAGRFF